MEIEEMNLNQLRTILDNKEISAIEMTKIFLDRITRLNPEINAFITITEEQALSTAKEADARLAAKEDITPLTGIPIAIKDNICTKGINTTCGSKMLANYIPSYDATVVTRLKDAGAVLIGKANLDEFAMGYSTESSYFGLTRNPWDLKRIPGGSSGGSAAAVAAGMVPLALGSDTGGSIRQPAAFCGIFGLKPTYGRVSRFGLVPYASSLDQIGPMARTTKDLAILYQFISGYDPLDTTTIPLPPEKLTLLSQGIKGLRFGIPREYYDKKLEPRIKAKVLLIIDILEQAGCIPVEVSIPTLEYATAIYYLIAFAEASSNLARYDGVRYGYRSEDQTDMISMFRQTRKAGFGREVKRRILLGTCFLTPEYYEDYYLKAEKVRALMKKDFARAFLECEFILTPTTTVLPNKIGEKTGDLPFKYLAENFTVSPNLTGIPGLTFPCGFIEGLPVGAQLMAPAGKEEILFQVASFLEDELGMVKLPALKGAV